MGDSSLESQVELTETERLSRYTATSHPQAGTGHNRRMYERNAQLLAEAASNRQLLEDISLELANLKLQYFEYEALQESERFEAKKKTSTTEVTDPFTIKKPIVESQLRPTRSPAPDPFTIQRKPETVQPSVLRPAENLPVTKDKIHIVEGDDFLSTSSMATSETSESSESSHSHVSNRVNQNDHAFKQNSFRAPEQKPIDPFQINAQREKSIDDVLASPPTRSQTSFSRQNYEAQSRQMHYDEKSTKSSLSSEFSGDTIEDDEHLGAANGGFTANKEQTDFQRTPARESSHSSILSWLKIDNKPPSKKDDLDWIINNDPLDMPSERKPPINPVESHSKSASSFGRKSATPISFGGPSNSQTPGLSSNNTLDIDNSSTSNDSLIDLVQQTTSGSQVRFNLANNVSNPPSSRNSVNRSNQDIIDEESISLYSSDSDFAPLPVRK